MGSLFGSLSFGYIIALMGSKRAITLLIIPFVAFWLLIYFGNVYYHILLARFIAGWAGGSMQTSLILYISEIANDKYGNEKENCSKMKMQSWIFF